MAGNCC